MPQNRVLLRCVGGYGIIDLYHTDYDLVHYGKSGDRIVNGRMDGMDENDTKSEMNGMDGKDTKSEMNLF